MAEEKTQAGDPAVEPETEGGLGLENFSMGTVRATETKEASEVASRTWRTIMWVVVVAVLVAGVLWWMGDGRNLFWQKSSADELFLSTLQNMKCVNDGLASSFDFENRITLKFQVAASLQTQSSNDEVKIRAQQALKGALEEIAGYLHNYLPNDEVRIKAYQGDEVIGKGEVMLKEIVPGKKIPVSVHIEGETMGGGQHVVE